MRIRAIQILFAMIVVITMAVSARAAPTINVIDKGARSDGTMNTIAIQSAIDQCTAAGGGQVKIPAGTFLTGALYLKDKVDLHLEAGAILLGSPHLADYPNNAADTQPRWHETKHGKGRAWRPDYELSLIRATGTHDISITGQGTINGNGRSKEFDPADENVQRPRILDLVNCTNVTVANIQLRDGAYWLERYIGCQHVHVQGIHVFSHANLNNDGIDMDASDCLIQDSSFDTDDDAICLKSDRPEPCRDVVIRNCTAASNCNAVKAGTASRGGFENIRITQITIHAASEHKLKKRDTGLAGIALEIVDGGKMDHVDISDVTMDGIESPIFIKLGNRGHHHAADSNEPTIGDISDVVLKNIRATGHGLVSSSITGFPGHDVHGIRLEHVILDCPGGGTLSQANAEVPEAEKDYPENQMFGPSLPASGLYIRHARDLVLDDVQLKLRSPDARPALILDDTAHIEMHGQGPGTLGSSHLVIRTRNTP